VEIEWCSAVVWCSGVVQEVGMASQGLEDRNAKKQ